MSLQGSGVVRILSASGAAWARIGITVFAQVALVPLYLSHWSPEEFGAWLLLQTVWGAVTTIDIGHQDFVGYECLRLGPMRRSDIIQVVVSALPIALFIAVLDLFLTWGLAHTEIASQWVGLSDLVYQQWRLALLIQALAWLLAGSWIALIVKGVTPFGYFPRIAWWNTGYALATAAAPGIAVLLGADLIGAMTVFALASIMLNLGCLLDLVRLVRPRNLSRWRPSLKQGAEQAGRSLWLTANGLVGLVRQQGVRLLLTPLSGVAQMAAFSTMRTGANFALQGLGTVTAPLMPELMRFLALRDQQRTESAFAVIWLILCAVLAPAVLVIQYFAPVFFPIWTRGKIDFDPVLFSTLSIGVLVFSLAQPAAAVVVGNNLLRSQLGTSILAGAVTIVGVFILVPQAGIRGAAFSLLIGELVNLLVSVYVASYWLQRNGMKWPFVAFLISALAVLTAWIGLALMSVLNESRAACLAVFLLIEIALTLLYWRSLPAIAIDRAFALVARFMPRRWRHRVAG